MSLLVGWKLFTCDWCLLLICFVLIYCLVCCFGCLLFVAVDFYVFGAWVIVFVGILFTVCLFPVCLWYFVGLFWPLLICWF